METKRPHADDQKEFGMEPSPPDEDLSRDTAIEWTIEDELKRTAFAAFVNGLELEDPDKAKLIETMSQKNYSLAVETARRQDPKCRIIPYVEIAAELMKYSAERFQRVCAMMEMPTLQIDPGTSFAEKVKVLSSRPSVVLQGREIPLKVSVVSLSDSASPYERAPDRKGKVSIDEGSVHLPVPHALKRLIESTEYWDETMKSAGMSLITPGGMVTLLQRSLIESEKTGDMPRILTDPSISTLLGFENISAEEVAYLQLSPDRHFPDRNTQNPTIHATFIHLGVRPEDLPITGLSGRPSWRLLEY